MSKKGRPKQASWTVKNSGNNRTLSKHNSLPEAKRAAQSRYSNLKSIYPKNDYVFIVESNGGFSFTGTPDRRGRSLNWTHTNF